MDNGIMAVLNDVLKYKRIIDKEKFSYSQVANSSINLRYLDGKKFDKVIIYLRGKGCDWSCKAGGGLIVDMDILERISNICKGKIVEIGMELERSNGEIWEKCINKGFSFLSYIEAVCKIRRVSNIKVLTYLTVKPLFLTIEESIKDVLKSILDIEYYTDIISLEPVNIQKNTVVDYLYEMGYYAPPRCLSIRQHQF